MNKVFIASVPLDTPHWTRYEAKDNSHLSYDKEVINPICLLLRGYAKKEDQVKIILCATKSPVQEANLAVLQSEILSIQSDIGFEMETVKVLDLPDDESLTAHMKLLSNLIALIEKERTIYMDITFGTKPTPIVYFDMLRFAMRIRSASIGCISYGRYVHTTKESFIFDVTALYRITTTIDMIADVQPADPEKMLNQMMGIMSSADA